MEQVCIATAPEKYYKLSQYHVINYDLRQVNYRRYNSQLGE